MVQPGTIEFSMVQTQKSLQMSIFKHQNLQLRLKTDGENADLQKELAELQRTIIKLGASQRHLLKVCRAQNMLIKKGGSNASQQMPTLNNGESEELYNKSKQLETDTREDLRQLTALRKIEEKKKEERRVKELFEEKAEKERQSALIAVPDENLLESMKKESQLEVEHIASSIDRKFGIPLESRKLDEKETFMACIGLVTIERGQEVMDVYQKYKLDYAMKHPLLEIPKSDSSLRRRHETYLSCVPKKKVRRAEREPSSEKEEQVVVEDSPKGEDQDSEGLPDQPFTEHQLSQGSVASQSPKDEGDSSNSS